MQNYYGKLIRTEISFLGIYPEYTITWPRDYVYPIFVGALYTLKEMEPTLSTDEWMDNKNLEH